MSSAFQDILKNHRRAERGLQNVIEGLKKDSQPPASLTIRTPPHEIYCDENPTHDTLPTSSHDTTLDSDDDRRTMHAPSFSDDIVHPYNSVCGSLNVPLFEDIGLDDPHAP